MHRRAHVPVESVFAAQRAQEEGVHGEKQQAGGHCIKLASLMAHATVGHILWETGQLPE
ncbi:hypothetical protein MCUN1_000597 [Malassezia cuniculi]|uniref:Uncharacterized protein n=1 Tax=Malassezia cuniculi TaxID=948313 RepID=A0AAF0J576_9BASI|nr:hypothetical protein MCUN1_000597 [Malassezia cuniculi]